MIPICHCEKAPRGRRGNLLQRKFAASELQEIPTGLKALGMTYSLYFERNYYGYFF